MTKKRIFSASSLTLSTLLDNLPGFVYRCQNDEKWTMEYVSQGILDITGYPPDDFIYNKVRSFDSIILPEDREHVNMEIEYALKDGMPFSMEYRIVTSGGEQKWVWERGSAIQKNGTLEALEGFVTDISEQHRDKEKLFQFNRLYAFLSQLNQVIVRARDKDILYKEICKVAVNFGRFRMAWVGEIDQGKKSIVPVAHAGYEQGYLKDVEISTGENKNGMGTAGQAYREGKVKISNNIGEDVNMKPWREKALKRKYLSSASIPFYTRKRVKGILNLYVSETNFFTGEEMKLLDEIGVNLSYALEALLTGKEHKSAEEELRLHSAAINSAANAIAITDINGTIQWVNPAWTVLTGYPEEEVIGMNPRILKSGKQSSEFYKGMWNTILSGDVWNGKLINKRKDGSLYYEEEIITPVRDKTGKITHFIAIKQDVSSRIKAEIKIRNLNEELEQRVMDRTLQLEAANKELEAFTYSVSHDLRAPLRVINGFTQILLEDYREKFDEEGTRIIDRIQSNVTQMGKLIDDLLALSRTGRAELVKTDIQMNAMIDILIHEIAKPEQSENINFKVGKLHNIKGDPALIRQVWYNLISNAIKFSSIRKRSEIQITSSKHDDKIKYCIGDNGAGFDMKYVDKLFGVFQRLHSTDEFKGTGVGLAIVQRIIHKHGGTVQGEGSVNKGATFYFTLPVDRG